MCSGYVCPCARLCALAPSGRSASMGPAWVGPLHWIQWAGGYRHLIPRGWRSGPGA